MTTLSKDASSAQGYSSISVVGFALLFATLTFALPPTARAGGWTQPAGEFYGKLFALSVLGNQAFLASGDVEPAEGYALTSLNYYLEYGLFQNWTAVAFVQPAGFAQYQDNSTFFVGPLSAGLRRGILSGPLHLAIEARYAWQPGVGETDLAGESDRAFIPAISTHQVDGELQAGLGFSWGWLALSSGIRAFSDDAIDPALTGFGQVGWTVHRRVWLDAHTNINWPVGEVEVTNIAGVGQTRYVGFGFGVGWWFLDRFGLTAALEGAFLAESNAAAPAIQLGLEMR